MDNLVFNQKNVFDEDDENKSGEKNIHSIVHIRVQQRSGTKSITIVEGLAEDLDLHKILKALRKTLQTNGTIIKDDDFGEIIKLQGDQRRSVASFLSTYRICLPSEIKIHGF